MVAEMGTLCWKIPENGSSYVTQGKYSISPERTFHLTETQSANCWWQPSWWKSRILIAWSWSLFGKCLFLYSWKLHIQKLKINTEKSKAPESEDIYFCRFWLTSKLIYFQMLALFPLAVCSIHYNEYTQ